MTRLSRADYAALYGPTTGDRIRLADTDLLIEVERDLTTPGEEVKFGGGKVVRDGMGQSQVTRQGGAMDTVTTGVVVFDHQGITKADVGLRDGRIAGIGKAGNRRLRAALVELAWLWLRYQPDSALAAWFRRRTQAAGGRTRKVMIVALARKLFVALWRFCRDGTIPDGAALKTAPA